ncbi:SDR family NAD(P)-dependent oxidoreductase [Kibdelosporangium phytohabitans]|uniref:Oxidoreductase n=1 Tax=Kibdelosporangium phytohabitans TaxID=860235 RepID=A0A0N9HNN2_9PSEU|nr:SDR family oxidoreductase [Kibdelosporangium phytohabitans]ALG05918.1 oxidoreductase [Kibdelosporangium phytohabitans]MBE1466034.1 NAD(P)-dependent dehydrogenase (short-subunit alcohol dehydrogenase family) [Kibdelosporangium phytohabitans]
MNTAAGKVALITGGSRGIGAATAVRLAKDGADVAFTYNQSADRAAEVVEQIKAVGRRALAIQADSASAQAVQDAVSETVAEFGRLDILVNNAGAAVFAPITELSIADFDHIVNINVKAVFVASRAAAAHLTSGGRIITIGSCAATRVAGPAYSLYSLSKTALIGLTKGLARDLGAQGITANLIHPGPIDTEMNPADGPTADDNRAVVALGKYGEAWDVAAAVSYLAGESGRYVSGAELAVDGGYVV